MLRRVLGISGKQAMVQDDTNGTQYLNLVVEEDGTVKALTDTQLEERKEE